MLNIMEHFEITERDGLSVHRLVEAIKFGFAARYGLPPSPPLPNEAEWKNRTKICDLDYTNDTGRIHEIPQKHFAHHITKNLTDVCIFPNERPFQSHPAHRTAHTRLNTTIPFLTSRPIMER